MTPCNKFTENTILNLLAVELTNQGISYENDSILEASVDYLLDFSINTTSLDELVLAIRQYIKDTQTNYPDYFYSGNQMFE